MSPSTASFTLFCCLAAPALISGFALCPLAPLGALRTSLLRPHGALRATQLPSVPKRRAGLSSCNPQMVAQDTHVQIAPYFTVPEGKMGEMKALWSTFYEKTKAGTDSCLYYGFMESGNKVFCREGYKDAAGCLAHLGDVDEPLKKTLEIVGEGGLDLYVYGPQSELDKLQEALGPLGTKFFAGDGSALWFGREEKGSKDSHVTICPTFTVNEGKMEEFQAVLPKFYDVTKKGTDQCLYYGFFQSGNKVFCREGYTSAAGALAHLDDVKDLFGPTLAIATADLAVMGPAAELEKLQEKMPLDAWTHYTMDEGSFWK